MFKFFSAAALAAFLWLNSFCTGAHAQAKPKFELVSSSAYATEEWVVAKFDFEPAVPEYSWRFENGQPRFIVTLLSTAIKDKAVLASPEVKQFPLWKISPYQGAENASLTFVLGYDSEHLVAASGKSLYVKFPRNVVYSRKIEIGSGAVWKTEAYAVSSRPLRYDWLEIPPSALSNLRVQSANSLDKSVRTMDIREMTRRTGAIAAVNAGFFNSQGHAVSTVVENGLFMTAGRYPSRPMMLFMRDGGVKIGRFTVRPELISGGKLIPLSGINSNLTDGATVVYNWVFPPEEIPSDGFLYALSGGRLTPLSGVLSELSSPSDYYIVTKIIPEANPLRDLPKDTFVEVRSRIYDRSSGQLLEVLGAVGGAPMLVSGGAVNVTSDEDRVQDDIRKNARARTAAAITGDGTVLLVTICEVRDGFYKGLKLEELASWLARRGAVTAFNLDGGGSTQLAVSDTIVIPYAGTPRKLNNAILFMP